MISGACSHIHSLYSGNQDNKLAKLCQHSYDTHNLTAVTFPKKFEEN